CRPATSAIEDWPAAIEASSVSVADPLSMTTRNRPWLSMQSTPYLPSALADVAAVSQRFTRIGMPRSLSTAVSSSRGALIDTEVCADAQAVRSRQSEIANSRLRLDIGIPFHLTIHARAIGVPLQADRSEIGKFEQRRRCIGRN